MTEWKDKPKEAERPGAPETNAKPGEWTQEQDIKAAAQALTTLARITGLAPTDIERGINEVRFRNSHQPKPVPMLDADTYVGHLYSARNIADKSLLWAAKLPMMTKLTISRDHEGQEQKGTVFGKPGDYLVKIQDRPMLEIIPQENFDIFYRWVPDSYWVDEVKEYMNGSQEARAIELEKAPTSQALAEYAGLFREVWGLGVTCRFQDGKLTIEAPELTIDAAQIIEPPEDADQPQYGYTLTRYGNGYIMLTDITGSQFPLLQGKVVDIMPKVLELFRKTEGLEIFGDFAWSNQGADNFVRKYLKHGDSVRSPMLKDEWQFAYYLLHRHSELLAHPERLEKEPKAAPLKKVERRRLPRAKKPTKAQYLEESAKVDAEQAKELNEGKAVPESE